jgi:hypothetical protein
MYTRNIKSNKASLFHPKRFAEAWLHFAGGGLQGFAIVAYIRYPILLDVSLL